MDPVTAGLVIHKAFALAKSAHGALKIANRLVRANDVAFLEARDEVAYEWGAEAKVRLDALIQEQARIANLLGESVEGLDEKVSALLEDHQIDLLAALYADCAYREALEERRKMLCHAAATIADLGVSIEEKCRVEKVLRDLDPKDIIELDRIARVVGWVRRLPDGRARAYLDEARFRYVVLDESKSRDALMSSGCIRELNPDVWGSVHAEPASSQAFISRRGQLVLRTMRSYVGPRRLLAPGRELPPGARSEQDARAWLEERAPGLASPLRGMALRARRAPEGRVQFDTIKARAEGPAAADQTLTLIEPPPTTAVRLHLSPVSAKDAAELPALAPDQGLALEVRQDAGGSTSLALVGPLDAIYWMAEDLDAVWG